MAHIYTLLPADRDFKLTKQQRSELMRIVRDLPDIRIAEAVFASAEPESAVECEAMAAFNQFVGENHPDARTKRSYLDRAKSLREDAKRARDRASRHLTNVHEVTRG